MARPKSARRFEPRYGVSQAAIEEEAKAVIRELEDHQVLALSELDAKRIVMHAKCIHSWEHFQRLVESLPKKEQNIFDRLLFRDFYQILELYVQTVRMRHPIRRRWIRAPRKNRRCLAV